MGPFLERRGTLLATFTIGVALRLVWIPLGTGTARFTTPDTASYVGFAERLPAILTSPDHQGLVYSLQRTAGYPVFLWLVSRGGPVDLTLVVVVQCLIGGVVSVWLCRRLAHRLFGPRAAAVAGLLLAVDPVSVAHSLQVGTETVFTAVLLGTLVAIDRCRDPLPSRARVAWGTVAGCGIGALAATRPVMFYFVPVGIGLVWWWSVRGEGLRWRRSGPVVGAAIAAIAIVGVWVVRNEAVAGRWMYSSAQAQNLFEYGAASVAAEEGHTPLRWDVAPGGESEVERAKDRLLADHPELTDGVDMSDPVNQSDVWGRLGRSAITGHPRGYLVTAALGLTRTLAGPGHTMFGTLAATAATGLLHVVVLTLCSGVLLIEYLFAIVGSWAGWSRGPRRFLALLGVPALFYLVVSAGPQAYARFRVPVAPLICVVAGLGIAVTLERLRASRQVVPAGERD